MINIQQQASDAFSVYIYKQYFTDCMTVKDLCEKHGIDNKLCNELINIGRNKSSVDYQVIKGGE